MPKLLRKIRWSRWSPITVAPWFEQKDVQADPLGDLATTANELSFWRIAEDEANLFQILTAILAMCQHADAITYAIIDEQVVSEIGISIIASKGNTPHEQANSWHCDLVRLSGFKLVQLAKLILEKGRTMRLPEKEALAHLANEVEAGRIQQSHLQPGLAKELEKLTRRSR